MAPCPLRGSRATFRHSPKAFARRSSLFDDLDPFSALEELDRDVAALNSQIASELLPPAPVRSSARKSTNTRTEGRLLPGGKGFARTRSSSGRSANSEWSSSESVVVWGVEPPRYTDSPPPSAAASPFSDSLTALAGTALLLYAAVALRLARATSAGETKFKRQARWRLAWLWPLLAWSSPEFRSELEGVLVAGRERRRREKGKGEEEEMKEKAEEVSGDGTSASATSSSFVESDTGITPASLDERR